MIKGFDFYFSNKLLQFEQIDIINIVTVTFSRSVLPLHNIILANLTQ